MASHQKPPNPLPPSSSKAPKPSPSVAADTQIPQLNSSSSAATAAAASSPLSSSSHLSYPELLRRRSHHLKQLSKCYRDHYWALMEELRNQHRAYYWKYGISPFKADQNRAVEESKNEGSDENNANIEGIGGGDKGSRCSFVGCKLKAMALTRFCHLHILSDPKQVLYKPCTYVIKSAQAGPITCGKPILRAAVPSLCSLHFQKAQKHMTRALKKAGLNVSSSSKFAPKFHVLVAEYVRQIQAKRRAARGSDATDRVVVKEEGTS